MTTTMLASRCRWCSASLAGRDKRTRYCSDACRIAMHNLRSARGAVVHDLLMIWAGDYRQRSALTDLGRMVRTWIAEDKAAGRELPEALWHSPVNQKPTTPAEARS